MTGQDIIYGNEPAVLVFADSAAGLARCRDSALAAGGRVGAALPIVGAAARLDEQPALDAVLVDVVEDCGDPLDRLLDRLDLAARGGRHASVVSLSPALIDIAAARAPHANVVLLCAPDTVERAAATGFVLASRHPQALRDRGEEPPMQLRQLSEEVGRIARTLAALSGAEHRQRAVAPPMHGLATGLPPAATIRSVIRARRLREQYFDAELFADPAWDMLLDLAAARIEHRSVAVSSLCIAASVPPTTALRWIKTLTDEGLFVRVADPRDGRRVFIELAEPAAEGMAAYFEAVERLGLGFA